MKVKGKRIIRKDITYNIWDCSSEDLYKRNSKVVYK